MLKERNFVWQVMNSRVHATCQQAGPSQQRAVSLVVVNWHFVVTFRLAAGRVACLRLLPTCPRLAALCSQHLASSIRWFGEALGLCWGSREPWLWVWLWAGEQTAVRCQSTLGPCPSMWVSFSAGCSLQGMGAISLPPHEAVPPGLCQNVTSSK